MPYVIISAQSGLLMALIILAILTVEAVNGIKKIRTLSKFRKGITASYEKETDWKKSKIKNQIFNFTSLILLIIFAFLLMWLKTDSSVPASLPYDTSEIPFATVIDFTDDKASYSTEKRYNLNIYEKWETPVAKTNYEWSESAKIKVRGGNEIAYGITVDYHDTIHPAVAKIIAKLYILEARFTPYAFAYFEESPALGFDYEVMYRTEAGDKVYVLQQDCRIISFSVGCFGEIPEEFDSDEFDDKCVKIIADSIKE